MKGKVEIRRWQVLDIYYYSGDIEAVRGLIKQYKAKGWTVETEVDSACNKDYEESTQLMKLSRIKTVRVKAQ